MLCKILPLIFCFLILCNVPTPPNRGFKREPLNVILVNGTLIDRYGSPSGKYASPYNTPFWQRSLPPDKTYEYHVYRVVVPIENVEMGHAHGYLGYFGCGLQYYMPL